MYDYAGRNTARFGGTLEWGNLDEKTLCLPAKAQCYEVRYLGFPSYLL